jgi:hypothetical protein
MKKGKNKRPGRRQGVRNGPRLDRVKAGARRVGASVRSRATRPTRPSIGTSIASLAGAAAGAVAGGLVVNQNIASPEVVSGIMALGGAAAAYMTDGNARVIANSIAAAGAGQFALTLMAPKPAAPAPFIAAATKPAALPAPATPPGSRKSSTGGAVVELFRDAAMDLDMIDDDEIRYGVRDAEFVDDVDAYDYAA